MRVVARLSVLLGAAVLACTIAWAQTPDEPTLGDPSAEGEGLSVSDPPTAGTVEPGAPRRLTVESEYDAMARAAEPTYRPGPVLSRGPGDPILFRGPFVLRKRPVAAEHKFPWDYGRRFHEVAKFRYYPFLAWDVFLDHGDCLQLLATNYLFNSAFPPKGTDCIEVREEAGLAYVEVPEADGATSKYLVLRLRDKTLKVTRIDDRTGISVFAVYTISGYSGARFAQDYVESPEPIELTILPSEKAAPAEGEHLRRLLEGWEETEFHGYWTLPEKNHVRDWGGIEMPRDLRVVDIEGEGKSTALPIDIGAFRLIFEQALTYTGRGYAPSPGADYAFPLFFPAKPAAALVGQGTQG